MNTIVHQKMGIRGHVPSLRCAWYPRHGPSPRGAIHCQFKGRVLIHNRISALSDENGGNEDRTYLPSLILGSSILATCNPVFAAMEASYSPEQGSETFKNIAGVGYIILVMFYFFRLFTKRAEKAASEPLASTAQNPAAVDQQGMDELSALDKNSEEESTPGDVTVVQCLIGVAQAGTICFLFYLLSKVVDDYFAHQDLPMQYTARNITLLIQSVVRGLVYLITFIFGANATGLAALAIQLVVDPDGVDRGLDQPKPKRDILPKVKVTDDLGSIKRAFKEAERMGQNDRKKSK